MLDQVLANTPLPGELFADKYRIERILGQGGMGVVLAATHVHLKERYAVKVLRASAMSDADAVERFLREGRASVKIQSEHVARVFDVGELPDRTPYIVMEYLEGSDFGELLEAQAGFAPEAAVDYILQACEAVAEAHALRIIHRDLKPSNLFLAKQRDGTDRVKVLDFGISKMAAFEPGLSMTRTTTILGSPLYMSPEQLKAARDVDERSDLWSIAIMLYQLIAGTPPFLGESLAELCAVVLSGRVPWLSDVAKTTPVGLSAVIATCLRPDPEDRYKNLADFADAVAPFGTARARTSAARIIATLGLPAVRATTFAARPAAPRARGSWLAGVGGIALAGAIGFVAVNAQRAPSAASAATAATAATAPELHNETHSLVTHNETMGLAMDAAAAPGAPASNALSSEANPPAPRAMPTTAAVAPVVNVPPAVAVRANVPAQNPVHVAAPPAPPEPAPLPKASAPLGAATSSKD